MPTLISERYTIKRPCIWRHYDNGMHIILNTDGTIQDGQEARLILVEGKQHILDSNMVRTIHIPAVLKCDCGTKIDLSDLENLCNTCGNQYDHRGNML